MVERFDAEEFDDDEVDAADSRLVPDRPFVPGSSWYAVDFGDADPDDAFAHLGTDPELEFDPEVDGFEAVEDEPVDEDPAGDAPRGGLGGTDQRPDPSLSPDEHKERVEAGLARAREVLGREAWSNSKFAGERYFDKLKPELKERYPDGVMFSYEGFPIFDPYAKATVVLEEGFGPTRRADFKKANAELERLTGEKGQPTDTVWHHKEDGNTLLLLDMVLHEAVRHYGGVVVTKAEGEWNKGDSRAED